MLYFDYAATTPVKKEVLEEMLPYFTQHWENPSAKSNRSINIRKRINKARAQIAESIHAETEEIYFTSGGTEADNWVIKGVPGIRHIITTEIEHSAVYQSGRAMEKSGVQLHYVPVDHTGMVTTLALEQLLKQTAGSKTLVSIIYGNNEIGTIQEIKQLSELAHHYGALFHTDAVQAYGQIPIDVKVLNVDFLSASGHKIGAPKGIGFLYKKAGIEITPLLNGGKQEYSLRGGTENVPYIVGLGKAASEIQIENESILNLRDDMINRILSEIPSAILNGASSQRLPNHISVSFQDIYGESLQMILESSGYIVANGSACNAGAAEGSRVLQAIGIPEDYQYGTIRITLSKDHTNAEANELIDMLKIVIQILRDENK